MRAVLRESFELRQHDAVEMGEKVHGPGSVSRIGLFAASYRMEGWGQTANL